MCTTCRLLKSGQLSVVDLDELREVSFLALCAAPCLCTVLHTLSAPLGRDHYDVADSGSICLLKADSWTIGCFQLRFKVKLGLPKASRINRNLVWVVIGKIIHMIKKPSLSYSNNIGGLLFILREANKPTTS